MPSDCTGGACACDCRTIKKLIKPSDYLKQLRSEIVILKKEKTELELDVKSLEKILNEKD